LNETVGTFYTGVIQELVDNNHIVIRFNGDEDRICELFGSDPPLYTYAQRTWPDVYDDLPDELKQQEYSDGAYSLLSQLIIENTASADPVGVEIGVVIRGKRDDDNNTLLVSLINAADKDISYELIYSGYSFMSSDISTSDSLYSTYLAAKNYADLQNTNIWTNEPPYYPADYILDVDNYAKSLLYLIVTSSSPVSRYVGQYIDDPISITFSKEVEGSYISSAYFRLIRTNNDENEYYDQVLCTVEKNELTVTVTPQVLLEKSSKYVLIVLGGETGISSIDSFKLEVNHSLVFTTTSIARPGSGTDTITGVDIWVGGDDGSKDILSQEESVKTIQPLSSIPSNESVGVSSLHTISIIFNDIIKHTIPANLISFKYTELPTDPDPFGERDIAISGVNVSENILSISIDPITSENSTNREYKLSIPAGLIFGMNKENPNKSIDIRFMGRLTPLYVLPHDITVRLAGWNTKIVPNISDYELYKLSLQKSIFSNINNGIPSTDEELLRRYQLVLCLMLLELLRNIGFAGGGIKSRSLLETKVEYYDADLQGLMDDLEDCINENSDGGGFAVLEGIKSGYNMNRPTKQYGIYR
jgi:hypothetical protein